MVKFIPVPIMSNNILYYTMKIIINYYKQILPEPNMVSCLALLSSSYFTKLLVTGLLIKLQGNIKVLL